MKALGSNKPSSAIRNIPARDLRFCEKAVAQRWYMGSEPVPSAFLSALSATFPLGEKFFIDSVRRFSSKVQGKLAEDIRAFVVQEAFHTREHLAFNKLVGDTGYSTTAMTERTRGILRPFRSKSALCQLGLTMALEHFTALFAHEVLTQECRLASAPDHVCALWRWHAMEEIEHKAVAFDTFVAATRHWSSIRRYAFRCRVMMDATRVLVSVVARNMDDLFVQDRLPRLATWLNAIRYFFGVNGVLTSMAPAYLAWFRPGFQPWDIDDRALVYQVAEELEVRAKESRSVVSIAY
jgi:predicted metal-dependent hydrolase